MMPKHNRNRNKKTIKIKQVRPKIFNSICYTSYIRERKDTRRHLPHIKYSVVVMLNKKLKKKKSESTRTFNRYETN